MADYYSILGLTKNASDVEIKSAFRRLAKIYHPDKNPNDPNAKNVFELILKAYNTLINPITRKRYDNQSSYSTQAPPKPHAHHQRRKGQKEWVVTDEDVKRREYYKKHYEHIKNKSTETQNATSKKHYSDYKYVLFATPIAVGLLMFIVSMFNAEPATTITSNKTKTNAIEVERNNAALSNGQKPYNGFYGAIKTFDTKYHLQINNSSSYDAVIVVFDKTTNHYLQHSYLQRSYSVDFLMLPKTGVYWKCVIGKNWNPDKLFFNNKISGGFDSVVQYQNWKLLPVIFNDDLVEDLSLLSVIDSVSKNKQYISNESDFFDK